MSERDDDDKVIPISAGRRYLARTPVDLEVAIKDLDGKQLLYIPAPGGEFDGWCFTPSEARVLAHVLLDQAKAAEEP